MIIVISGNGAVGKTTLGRLLAKRLKYTFYSKDMFKEALFNQSRRPKLLLWRWYDHTAKQQLYEQIMRSRAAHESMIVESNFEPRDRSQLRIALAGEDVTELFLYARQRAVVRRYIRRLNTGEKHPGHYDWLWVPIVLLVSGVSKLGLDYFKPTGVTDNVLRVDTTDFDKVSIEQLVQFVTKHK